MAPEVVTPRHPGYEFVPIDWELADAYNHGVQLPRGISSIETKNDGLCYNPNVKDIIREVKAGGHLPEKHTRDWKTEWAEADIRTNPGRFLPVTYRPFDIRITWYSGVDKGFMSWPNAKIFAENEDALFLCTTKISRGQPTFQNVFIVKGLVDRCAISNSTYVINTGEEKMKQFAKKLLEGTGIEPRSGEVLWYVYGRLWDPVYRRVFVDQLRADFPRVPRPASRKEWEFYVDWGRLLVDLHLQDIDGLADAENLGADATDVKHSQGRVHFADGSWIRLSDGGWKEMIGYYQPIKKWLSYRRRVLTTEEFDHVRRMCWTMDTHHQLMVEFELASTEAGYVDRLLQQD